MWRAAAVRQLRHQQKAARPRCSQQRVETTQLCFCCAACILLGCPDCGASSSSPKLGSSQLGSATKQRELANTLMGVQVRVRWSQSWPCVGHSGRGHWRACYMGCSPAKAAGPVKVRQATRKHAWWVRQVAYRSQQGGCINSRVKRLQHSATPQPAARGPADDCCNGKAGACLPLECLPLALLNPAKPASPGPSCFNGCWWCGCAADGPRSSCPCSCCCCCCQSSCCCANVCGSNCRAPLPPKGLNSAGRAPSPPAGKPCCCCRCCGDCCCCRCCCACCCSRSWCSRINCSRSILLAMAARCARAACCAISSATGCCGSSKARALAPGSGRRNRRQSRSSNSEHCAAAVGTERQLVCRNAWRTGRPRCPAGSPGNRLVKAP